MKTLSDQATSVWAKTGGPTLWLPLVQHLADTARVGAYLYDHWLSPLVRDRWLSHWKGTPHELRALVQFVCGNHDIGKAAPVFVFQSEPLAQRSREAGLPCPSAEDLKADRRHLPHSLVSQHAIQHWLQKSGVPGDVAQTLSSIAGAHHGEPMSEARMAQPRRRRTPMGREPWQQVRVEILDWLAQLTGFDRLLEAGTSLDLPLPTLVELSGLVVVADWLASNTELFPLRSRDADGSLTQDETRTPEAWATIAMPPPWAPPLPTETSADTFFASRFQFGPDSKPHPVQATAFELAQSTAVGLMFIETTTGGGKTEAALAVAELLAARTGAQGMLVALPTQATTNAMFERVSPWIERLPEPPADVAAWAVTLGHGKARLNPLYSEMVEEVREFERIFDTGNAGPIFEEPSQSDDATDQPGRCNAVVHSWFLSAKRRMLANFTIVTIDQLLMAALQRKHLMLAHIALSGKVVIIDEAHSSDDYMFVYLDSVLSWLGAYGVPVIVLSATLTAERRAAMMAAYAPRRADEIQRLTFSADDYPLITVVPQDDSPIKAQVVPDESQARQVEWQWHPTDIGALVDSVHAAIADGGCALVVRNTVGDAQATAEALTARGLEVTLNHAGFLASDRASNDADLIARFGKSSRDARPHQAVVVATQVVEQSLDIDFDVLFTDLAPADLILQRIGRLHRHPWRRRPPHHANAQGYLLADAGPGVTPPIPSPGSETVYGEYHLLRTSMALTQLGPKIELPHDVSPLVTAALGPESVPLEAWAEPLAAARNKHEERMHAARTKAATWCIAPYSDEHKHRRTLAEWLTTKDDPNRTLSPEFSELQAGATVRDTQPSLEVIVVPTTPDGLAAIRPPWSTNEIEVIDVSSLPTDDLAREIATWTVRLPHRLTGGIIDEVIETIGNDPRTKRWPLRRHSFLRSELLLVMPQSEEGSTTLTTTITVKNRTFELRYSPHRGIEVIPQ